MDPVLGNPRSTTCWLSTRPFLYPDYGPSLRAVDGWALCRRPGCPQCAASPEAATMHIECFELFARTYTHIDALERLWRATAWRKPWRDAPPVILAERTGVTSTAIATVAQKYDLLKLSRMPLEIRGMVRDYSGSALFWRLVAALDLAAQFEALPTKDFDYIPLCNVAGWERGRLPTQSTDLHHLPIIRLTIDSQGIRKLERLSASELRYSSRRFDNMVFVVKDEGCFKGVMMLFKVRSPYYM